MVEVCLEVYFDVGYVSIGVYFPCSFEYGSERWEMKEVRRNR